MSKVDFTNVHHYINQAAYQFIDVREPYELQLDGFIQGFACVPFYTTLIHKNIIQYVRDPKKEEAVLDKAALLKAFDPTKDIYLMCNTGTRSGYLTLVLQNHGFRVTNLGGIHDYLALKKQI